MQATVLLGGSLRHEAGGGNQAREIVLGEGSTVGALLTRLGLPPERVKLILVNGRGATLDTTLEAGDRVGLFPPELSFNTFVSLSFRREVVEARKKGEKTRSP
jgi:molybdopterin converting factor small subunit